MGTGRPEFKPTDEQRRFVTLCTMGGINHEQIAKTIGISRNTLEKHFREELDNAAAEANARVVGVAYEQAVSGQHPAMTMFWLKTRLGWREKKELEHSGEVTTKTFIVTIDGDE